MRRAALLGALAGLLAGVAPAAADDAALRAAGTDGVVDVRAGDVRRVGFLFRGAVVTAAGLPEGDVVVTTARGDRRTLEVAEERDGVSVLLADDLGDGLRGGGGGAMRGHVLRSPLGFGRKIVATRIRPARKAGVRRRLSARLGAQDAGAPVVTGSGRLVGLAVDTGSGRPELVALPVLRGAINAARASEDGDGVPVWAFVLTGVLVAAALALMAGSRAQQLRRRAAPAGRPVPEHTPGPLVLRREQELDADFDVVIKARSGHDTA